MKDFFSYKLSQLLLKVFKPSRSRKSIVSPFLDEEKRRGGDKMKPPPRYFYANRALISVEDIAEYVVFVSVSVRAIVALPDWFKVNEPFDTPF